MLNWNEFPTFLLNIIVCLVFIVLKCTDNDEICESKYCSRRMRSVLTFTSIKVDSNHSMLHKAIVKCLKLCANFWKTYCCCCMV